MNINSHSGMFGRRPLQGVPLILAPEATQSPLASPEGFPALRLETGLCAALVQHHAVAGQ